MKVPEDAPRSGRKRRMPPRSGPQAPVPLWDPPSGLDPMGRLELEGLFARGVARRLRDPRTSRRTRMIIRIGIWLWMALCVLPIVVVVLVHALL